MNCFAFDSEGNIYVASAITAEVIKFNQNEEFVTSFTGGGLSSPMGIARDENDVLYVAGGGSSNIVKFDTDGNYLGQIRHPDLSGPQGVAFDDRGHIFSSSFFQDNIVEFDTSGEYVQTITAGGLDIPRSIAFIPTIEELLGDFDGDGILNAADIDLLSQAVLTGVANGSSDLTGDGVISSEDRTYWVQQIAETNFGDADLNGAVEFSDFLAVSRNFGSSGGWASGDFDGNREIGFPDFLLLSSTFGQTNPSLSANVEVEVTEVNGFFTYEYTVSNETNSLARINTLFIDVVDGSGVVEGIALGPNHALLDAPEGWFGDYVSDAGPVEEVSFLHAEGEFCGSMGIAPGTSETFTIESEYGPEMRNAFAATLVSTCDLFFVGADFQVLAPSVPPAGGEAASVPEPSTGSISITAALLIASLRLRVKRTGKVEKDGRREAQ